MPLREIGGGRERPPLLLPGAGAGVLRNSHLRNTPSGGRSRPNYPCRKARRKNEDRVDLSPQTPQLRQNPSRLTLPPVNLALVAVGPAPPNPPDAKRHTPTQDLSKEGPGFVSTTSPPLWKIKDFPQGASFCLQFNRATDLPSPQPHPRHLLLPLDRQKRGEHAHDGQNPIPDLRRPVSAPYRPTGAFLYFQEIGETASLAALKRAIEVEPLARSATIAEILDCSGAGASGRTSESRQNESDDDLTQGRHHLEHNQSDDDCNDHPGQDRVLPIARAPDLADHKMGAARSEKSPFPRASLEAPGHRPGAYTQPSVRSLWANTGQMAGLFFHDLTRILACGGFKRHLGRGQIRADRDPSERRGGNPARGTHSYGTRQIKALGSAPEW